MGGISLDGNEVMTNLNCVLGESVRAASDGQGRASGRR